MLFLQHSDYLSNKEASQRLIKLEKDKVALEKEKVDIENKALFEKEGVKIAGVIINKVKPEKYDTINRIVRMGLKKKGLRVLGVIPYRKLLSAPTIAQILEELNFKLIRKFPNNRKWNLFVAHNIHYSYKS